MSIQNELINSGRKQKLKSPEVFRSGRVNNSGAYLRGPKADPTAGKGQASMASFLGDMNTMFDLGVKVQQDWVKDEEAKGKAHWTKASPELRAKLRNAIKTGTMSESESFAWRQGVSEAYTATLLGEYNTELFKAYERNEYDFNKNDEKSGSLQAFIDKFDEQYKQHFETIDEETLLEHFVPGQMGIQRQLQQRHTEHLNSEYVRHSMNAKQGAVFEMFRGDVFTDITKELNKGDFNVEHLVKGGGEDNQTRLEHLDELETYLIEFNETRTLSPDFEEWLGRQSGGTEVIKELKAISGKDPEKVKAPKKKKGVLEETQEVSKKKQEKVVPIEDKKSKTPEDEMSDVNLSTKFKSLDHVAEVLKATPEEVEAATRAVTKHMKKGKFTSYDGTVYDDLNAIHPMNWNETQTKKIIEAIRYARQGKVKSGS